MKYLILFSLIISQAWQQADNELQDTALINARYNGGSEQGYYFTNLDTNEIVKFAKAEASVMEEFDLNSKEWVGEEFELEYSVDYEEIPAMQSMAEKEGVRYQKEMLTIIRLETLDSEDTED